MKYTRNLRELQSRPDGIPRVIGLTGGIACGKSVATDALRKDGFTVIDADEISRNMFAVGTDGEHMLARLFPDAVCDGKLDRAVLRRIISRDAEARQKLNDATHPAIISEISRRLNATDIKPVVLCAPLLFETGLSTLCDATVCVYCPRAVRIERLTRRDSISAADAAAMIDAQIPDTERCTVADYIVPSDREAHEFADETIELFRVLAGRLTL